MFNSLIFRLFVVAAIVCAIGLWEAGTWLSAPHNHKIKIVGTENYSFEYSGTKGTIIGDGRKNGCALLLHAVRSDRTSMVRRAIFLKTLGMTSAIIDLQAHGETIGKHITFGYLESRDAAHGVAYLKEVQHCTKIIAIGSSLGGASTLLGEGPLPVDALVLESVYPSIEQAVRDRLEIRFGWFGRLIAPLLYLQIPMRTEASLESLRPISAISRVKCPLFIIGGSNDRHTKAEETKLLFDTAKTQYKYLWLVNGAVHEDIYAFAPREYESKLQKFIESSLRGAEETLSEAEVPR